MENTKEEFRDIPNYEGCYQVSNLGRVKSLSRWRENGNKGYNTKEKILKLNISSNGYLGLNLSLKGKSKSVLVHHLVAIAFLNHIPNGYKGLIVNHINNLPTDNRVENLQLTTVRVNVSKDIKKGLSISTGVTRYKRSNKWISRATVKNKYVYLGSFTTELEASKMYQKALSHTDKYNGSDSEFRNYLNSL